MPTRWGPSVQIVPVPERVRAFELDPAMPSGALPIFGEYLDRIGQRLLLWPFVLVGVGQFFTKTGIALPLGTIALFGFFEVAGIYRRHVRVPETRLKREPFRQVDIAADGLVVAGRTVGVRLPDGRWLRIRLGEAFRLLLAGHRRVWLLGSGPKVFAGFPGVYGDRVYAIRSSASSKGFPYFTGRDQGQMLRYGATFRYPDRMAAPPNLVEAEALGPGITPLYAGGDDLDMRTPTCAPT